MGRLLVVSHTGRRTGFGRVAAHAARSLAAGDRDVHVIGLGADAAWTAHAELPGDVGCGWTGAQLTAELRPAATIAFGSARYLDWLVPELQAAGDGLVLAYAPTEGEVRTAGALPGLAEADVLVAHHRWGAAQLRRAAGPAAAGVTHIPHPLLVVPRPPLAGDALLAERTRLLPQAGNLVTAVWLLNANRSDRRKNIAASLRVFSAIVRQGRSDAVLVLHASPHVRGEQLAELAARLGIAGQVLFTHDAREVWSDEDMAALYGVCEIGLNTASGESWGLTAFEHAACGAAQALPMLSAQRELWGDAPVWLPVEGEVALDRETIGSPVDEARATDALLALLAPGRRREVAERCRRVAMDRGLSPEEVGSRWCELVGGALQQRGRRRFPPSGQRRVAVSTPATRS